MVRTIENSHEFITITDKDLNLLLLTIKHNNGYSNERTLPLNRLQLLMNH